MPELPEVETTRRGIKPYIDQKKVSEVIVRQPKLRWPVPPEIHQMEPKRTACQGRLRHHGATIKRSRRT